jgi:hypothetical protein
VQAKHSKRRSTARRSSIYSLAFLVNEKSQRSSWDFFVCGT